MIPVEISGSIGRSISFRAGLATELERKLTDQTKRDEETQKELLRRAPKSLKSWLANEDVLKNLFRYGQLDTKIVFFNEAYGFGGINDVRRKMVALQNAWEGAVNVYVDPRPEPHRVNVILSAAIR